MHTPSIVILDRDGVINEDSDDYVKSADEWQPIEQSPQAIARLSAAGYRIGVATNQSGLARGLFDEFTLARIHEKMIQTVEEAGGFIESVCYCPHHPDENCNCRKPATGLLEQLASQFSCSLEGCFMVGDSLKDLQAARNYGMSPVLVRTGKGKATEQQLPESGLDVPVFDDLSAFVDEILG